MKIKKLYAEPEMKLHKLCTSRIMAGSYEGIAINPGGSKEGEEDFDDEVGGGD